MTGRREESPASRWRHDRVLAGLVLCGGQSRRMGVTKATLPVGVESMLERVIRLLAPAVDRVVVVAGPQQQLPQLDPSVLVVRDKQQGLGPLAGLETGLGAVADHSQIAYVTACDAPLLVQGFVRRMCEFIEDHLVAVPVDRNRFYPLAAIYDVRILNEVQQLLAAGERRIQSLFDVVDTRRVDVASLRDVDPPLASLSNVNRPADYLELLNSLGLSAPPEVIELFQDR